jgi:hypothetical protein
MNRLEEGLRNVQGDSTAPLGKRPIPFPLGEKPTGCEGADVGKGTKIFVGDVDSHSRWLHVPRFAGEAV